MLIVIMGPCGCGKSTIGQLLSQKLDWVFIEGDNYHSEKNRQKMAQGEPLIDEDRLPWLKKLHEETNKHENVILACSALKRMYREILANPINLNDRKFEQNLFILLKADKHLLTKRLNERKGHFMHPLLIDSQLNTLELFNQNEQFLIIDAQLSCEVIIEKIMSYLNFT